MQQYKPNTGLIYQFRINTYTLLCIKQVNNNDLLYSTGNCTQYLIITYDGKESGREYTKKIYIYTQYVHTHTRTYIFMYSLPDSFPLQVIKRYCINYYKIYIYTQLDNFAVYLKLNQCCKLTVFQLIKLIQVITPLILKLHISLLSLGNHTASSAVFPEPRYY